jgi:hypothetical protein
MSFLTVLSLWYSDKDASASIKFLKPLNAEQQINLYVLDLILMEFILQKIDVGNVI